DLNLVKFVRTGIESGGLYLFDVDQIDNETPKKPNDDEREPSGDGNVMASIIHDSFLLDNEEATLATQLDDNNDISEGSKSNSNGSRSCVES
ncbi:hypothetical protein Tco_0816429, partial [Tanacetum coccineum]